jgi:heat shock protein HtpX
MNIRAQRFASKSRTWLLIAGLTALLIGIGALIGGAFLYLFVAFAVALNVVGYWFSDRLALRTSRAKPVEPGTMPELEAMVEELAQLANVPTPRLYTIESEQPNAFATGRNPKHAAVAVTDGLLQQLPAEQVKGVLAHEFAHIKNRDILVSSIAAMVAGAIAAIANILQFSLIFGGDDEDSGPLGWIGLTGRSSSRHSPRRCCSWAWRDQVVTLLTENRAQLDALASALLERETLDEDDAYAAAGVRRSQAAPAGELAVAARSRT